MPVLLEAISVVVRRATLEERYPGGLDGYVRDCPNGTYCVDDHLTRVGFMAPPDVQEWVRHLEHQGLRLLGPDGFDEVAIVDQNSGPTRPCPWIDWVEWFDGPNYAYLAGTSTDSGVAVPAGWTRETSLKQTGRFVPTDKPDTNLEFVRRDGHVNVYRDRRTGQEWYRGQTSDESPS